MKLFKKVMASVLAGVLALSMVACGTTVVLPGDVDLEDPAASASNSATVDTVLKYLNKGLGNDADMGDTLVEADEEMSKYAQVYLEAMAAYAKAEKTDEIAANFSKYLATRLLAAGCVKEHDVYSVAEGSKIGANINFADFLYDGGKTNKVIKETLASADGDFAAAVEADAKVGIASKTIGGKTFVIIVTSAVAAPAENA